MTTPCLVTPFLKAGGLISISERKKYVLSLKRQSWQESLKQDMKHMCLTHKQMKLIEKQEKDKKEGKLNEYKNRKR